MLSTPIKPCGGSPAVLNLYHGNRRDTALLWGGGPFVAQFRAIALDAGLV